MFLAFAALVASGAVYAVHSLLQPGPSRKAHKPRPSADNGTAPTAVPQPHSNTALSPNGARGPQPLEALSLAGTREEERALNRRLAVSASVMGLTALGYLAFPWLFLVTVPSLIYLTLPHLRDGYKELTEQHRVGAEVFTALSVYAMLACGYFFLTSVLYVVFLLSQKLVYKTRDHSERSLFDIFGELPRSVWVQHGEVEVEVPIETVQVGDRIVVRAGEAIPVDGIIAAGFASIDQRMLTGESQPAEKGPGDPVFAATVVLSGKIAVHVEKVAGDTVVAQIQEILRSTIDYRSSLQLRGEVIADRTVLPTLALSGITLPLLGPDSAIAVLMVYFGYDMRILAPLSVLNFLHLASQEGILVKDGRALEALEQVDTVVFDKTGTLTQDQPHVADIHPCAPYTADEVLAYAASVEYRQTHPIARAIQHAAAQHQLPLQPIEDTAYELGYGLKAQVATQLVRVGSARFMELEGVKLPADMQEQQRSCHARGAALVFVAIDHEFGGAIELHATIRPEAKRLIEALHQRHLTLCIISGDHAEPTQQLARELGIEHYFADVLPEDKADLIAQLQQAGKKVCFIGDGINDAIALKRADVSISLRGASTIAMDTAQIVLLDESLHQLLPLFRLADALDTNMKVNFALTIIPSVVTLCGIYFLQFGIFPAAMMASLGFGLGLGNAMLPRLRQSQSLDRAKEEPHLQ